jgi:hypothetical protein
MPLLSGWLEKKGHLVKNWKRRYVVVEANVVSYYLDESLAKIKGTIKLDDSTKVLVRDGRTHSWKFRIITQGKNLELSASTENDRDFWVSTIRETLGSKGKRYIHETASSISNSLASTVGIVDAINDYDSEDSESHEEVNESGTSGHLEGTKPSAPKIEYSLGNLPDIPLDILPDLDDLIGK